MTELRGAFHSKNGRRHAPLRSRLIVGEATVEAEFGDVWSDTELNEERVAYVPLR